MPMTTAQQLGAWVGGESLHNPDADECCPDFSCCNPELLAPFARRARFARALLEEDELTKRRMLSEFLGAMLKLRL